MNTVRGNKKHPQTVGNNMFHVRGAEKSTRFHPSFHFIMQTQAAIQGGRVVPFGQYEDLTPPDLSLHILYPKTYPMMIV